MAVEGESRTPGNASSNPRRTTSSRPPAAGLGRKSGVRCNPVGLLRKGAGPGRRPSGALRGQPWPRSEQAASESSPENAPRDRACLSSRSGPHSWLPPPDSGAPTGDPQRVRPSHNGCVRRSWLRCRRDPPPPGWILLAGYHLRAPVLRLQRDSGQQVGQHRLLQSRSDHLPPFPPRVQAPVLHQDGKRGAGGPFDQWMRHLPSLPAAGVARDPDPLLQQRSLQWIPCLLLLPCLLPPDLVDSPAYLPPVKQSSETPGRLSGHAAAARWPQISFVILGPLAAIRRGGFIVILH
ncbi:uncharacterized protein [Pituophis catenifer annectens]|uniref:uncharacterized protein n=1 Tax=Pituophis catenifer annectens TaxID=94852 RepID=UPI003994BA07